MRASAIGLAVATLAMVAVANAQYDRGGGFGYGVYQSGHASTAAEGAMRGAGDLIRSGSVANLNNSEAAINMTEAAKRGMENRQQWTDTYFQMRDANRQYRAAERGPKMTMEQAVRLAQSGKPDALSPSDLDSVDGGISWPMMLQSPKYADYRAQLEGLFSKRAELGGISTDDYFMISRSTRGMLDQLKTEVRTAPPAEYMAAKRFIESLAFEANRPAG